MKSRFSTFRRLRGAAAATVMAVGVVSALPLSPVSSATVGQLRTGDNTRLGADENPFRVKTAPSLAVDPANPDRVLAGLFDLGFEECQTAVSNDGGATWTDPVNLVAPQGYYQEGQQPCTVLGHGANAMDHSVAFGSGQNAYVVWAVESVTVPDGGTGAGNQSVLFAKSTDDGETFGTGTVAMQEGPTLAAGPHYAFPKITVLPNAGVGGADRIVLAAAAERLDEATHTLKGHVEVTVSDDGGTTWSVPVIVNKPINTDPLSPDFNPYGAVEATQLVVTPNGDYYIGWRTTTRIGLTSQMDGFQDGFVRVAKSTDGGATWTETTVIDVHGYVYTGPATPPYGSGGAPTTVRFGGSAFPRLAAGTTTNDLYLTWAEHTGWYNDSGAFVAQDHFHVQNSAVWFSRSTDGNVTWSEPNQINRSPIMPASMKYSPAGTTINHNVNGTQVNDPIENHLGDTQTRHPNVSVAPDGRIDLVWHDRRHGYQACSHTHVLCQEMRLGDTYYAYSTDGGTTFSPNRRITDRSMNNDVGYDYKFSTYWDYGPVSAPLGNTGKVLFAWMDSREGNFDTDAQDIYTATLNLDATGDPVVKSLGTGQSGDLSAALSRAANPGGSEGRLGGTFASRAATHVVIAKAGDTAGILAGGVLARANAGPLLLSSTGALLPSAIKDEVTRMSPIGAYLVGGTKTLSKQVETDLVNLGLPASSIVRIEGKNAFAVAKNIAEKMDQRTATEKTAGLPAFDAAIIALASGPDAVAASTLAVNRRLPVLYVNKKTIPADTANALASLNINKTLVIGGPRAVSGAVFDALASSGRNPTRLGGADQYATSKVVLQASITDWKLPVNQVFVADGSRPEHGALLGSASGRIGGLLLLTPGGSSDHALTVLDSLGLTSQVDRILTSALT